MTWLVDNSSCSICSLPTASFHVYRPAPQHCPDMHLLLTATQRPAFSFSSLGTTLIVRSAGPAHAAPPSAYANAAQRLCQCRPAPLPPGADTLGGRTLYVT